MKTNSSRLAEAYALDQKGRWAEAVEGYRAALAADPHNSDGLHLLGVAMAKLGRLQEAIDPIKSATVIQPKNPFMLINLGNVYSGLGRHSEALTCFERALAVNADLPAALLGRGAALLRLGQPEAALQSLEGAARNSPGDARIASDLGVALERLDRKLEARRYFERAIALNPNHAEAHHNLGLLEAAAGRPSPALAHLDRALALQPTQAAIHANRGNALCDLGRPGEALLSYDRAIALRPGDANTHRNRGRALMTLERHSDAVTSFDAALAFAPRDFETHFYRGVALASLARHADAVASFEQALLVEPHSVEALNNRGAELGQVGRFTEALASWQQALDADANHMGALVNTGNTLIILKQYRDALRYLDRAAELAPADPKVAWGKARLLLTLGDFAEGWQLFESRLNLDYLRPLQRHAHVPRWDPSQSLEGKTVLVHAEQGLGDTIQFCRYVPLLEARGVTVIFEVQAALLKLLGSLDMHGTLVAVGEPLPRFDLRTPLLSLPLAMGTQLDSIPHAASYLSIGAAAVAVWRAKIAGIPGLKVGLTWQGNLETEKQGGFLGRSFSLASAAPLAHVDNVNYVSLQKGADAAQLARVPFRERIRELIDPTVMGADEILETAALMLNLDLIITSDTFTAHLAGALGIPVWVALNTAPDWRWLTDRDDSPWYPSMRLFRQQTPGDWRELFERVAAELRNVASNRPSSS